MRKSKDKISAGAGSNVRLKISALIACWMVIIFAPASFSQTDQPLEITNAYMPPIPPVSRTAAVYLTFRNRSDSTKTISSVSSPIAQQVMFHETTEQNGLSKMKHREKISIEPNEKIELAPGGVHLMLMGVSLKPSVKVIQLMLSFESGEQQVLSVPITSKKHAPKAVTTKTVLRKLVSKKTTTRKQ